MDALTLEAALAGLPLGEIHFLPRVGSTNEEAMRQAAGGAPHLSIVAADEQTAGRGRAGRRWYTPAGTALAVSVVVRPQGRAAGQDFSLRLSGLGAVSIAQALRESYGLPAAVKWPNDVLLEGRKVAGVLVETAWVGARWAYAVVGMGVNVRAGAVPRDVPLRFPAGDVEHFAGHPIASTSLLYEVLRRFVDWLTRLDTPEFLHAWENLLAYRRQAVVVERDGIPLATGILQGLAEDGALRVEKSDGSMDHLHLGELSLRPAAEN